MEEYWIFKTNMAKCKFCDKEYRDYIDKHFYKTHMIKKHNDIFKENVDWLFQYFELQNNRLKCNVCYLKYKIKVLLKLRKHSKKYHQNKSEIDRGKGNRHKREDYWWIEYCTLENGKAQCRFCDSFYYITIYKYPYENHVAIGHSEIYNKIDKKENWIWQYFVFRNNRAMCDICKRYFLVSLQSKSFRRHLNAKHKNKMKEKQDDESGQGIHGNEETNMKSLLESLINDVIQMYKK